MLSRFSYLNPVAEKVRVMYTGTNAIYEGMPLCYEFESTSNIDGYDIVDGAGSTTDEGHQNEGKYIRVHDPDADNDGSFAGVVAGKEHEGVTGTGEKWLEMYVPNGAVVPVRCDQNCVVGRTILAINTTEQFLTAPHGAGRPVAVAWETVDRSAGATTTPGIVLAKLEPNLFLYQKADADNLLVDDVDTDWQRVNTIAIEYAGSQWLEALNVELEQLAACTGTGLALKAQVQSDKVTSGGYSTALEGAVEIGAGFGGTATAVGGYRAITAKLNVASGADLSSQRVSCLYLEHYIHAGATGPLYDSMIQLNCTLGTNKPQYFIYAQSPECLAYQQSAAVAGSKVGAIKLLIVGATTSDVWIRTYDSAV